VGTALFALTASAAVVAPDALEPPAFVVAVGRFFAGCVAFVLAYSRAVGRSRRELISVADLFFLAGGSAPSGVRSSLLGSLGLEVAIALASAFARPYSSLAAGTLVPVYGLGLCGLWASRYGTFPPRPDEERRGRRPPADGVPPPGRTPSSGNGSPPRQ
jgi:hypothetical protein